jgi:syntaxin-binding protein 1
MVEIVKLKMAASNDVTEDIEKGGMEDAGKSYIALLVDTHTLRIVSAACRQYDIMERGVTVVEQIEKPRQPLSDLDAVYFLTPSEQSVDSLLNDHRLSSPLYRCTHVFFSGPLSEKLFDSLAKEESFVNRCYSLYELNVDYVAFEPRVIHCDMPMTVRYLKGPTSGDVMPQLIRRHIDCLTSICASMKEKPVIRYMARSTVSNLSEKIALGFRREIDAYAGAMDRLRKPLKNRGTTFLILDRSVESSGLLVHEYSYQALALDVLDRQEGEDGIKWQIGMDSAQIGDDNGMSVLPSFSFKTITGKGEEEEKHVVLADHDDLWVKFRHAHVKDVSEMTAREVREFSKTHDLAKLQRGDGRRNSDADPMELLRGLPEYQDILSKYSVHIELSKKCFDAIDKQKIMEIGKIEQDLATGVDDEGKDVSCIKVFQSLSSLVQSGRIGPEEKLRLVALYLSQVNDVNESSAQTLVRTAAALSVENESLVKQFLSLGIHGTRTATAVGGSASPTDKTASNRHSHKLANDKNLIKRNKTRAKASTYVNCRFVPKLKEVVESVLNNNLDAQEFPVIGASNAAGSVYSVTSNDSAGVASTKSAAALWGETKAMTDGQEMDENKQQSNQTKRQKVVVFVIGGITLAETRAMAELEREFNCDVVIGGSCILTPKRLFDILQAPTPIF